MPEPGATGYSEVRDVSARVDGPSTKMKFVNQLTKLKIHNVGMSARLMREILVETAHVHIVITKLRSEAYA